MNKDYLAMEPGFYWIRLSFDDWTIGEYFGDDNWEALGYTYCDFEQIKEVGNRIIKDA